MKTWMMRTVEAFEDFNVLMKGVTKTIEHEMKDQR